VAAEQGAVRLFNPEAVRMVPLADLQLDPDNERVHSERNLSALAASLDRFGQQKPVIAGADLLVRAGNGMVQAARSLGWEELAVYITGLEGSEAAAYRVADNRTSDLSFWDMEKLTDQLQQFQEEGDGLLEAVGWSDGELLGLLENFGSPGSALDGLAPQPSEQTEEEARTLADRFVVPPISVLDGRQGYWQNRKRAWLALGIQSEVGRGSNLLRYSDTLLEPDAEVRAAASAGGTVADKSRREGFYQNEEMGGVPNNPEAVIPGWYKKRDKGMSPEEIMAEWKDKVRRGEIKLNAGTSVFDPVLCELVYRWFCPPGGRVLDPFAGGSVRGILAAKLGRHYVGVDLSGSQIAENLTQAKQIVSEGEPKPRWIVGDSRELPEHLKGKHGKKPFDLLFTCPPYYNLEVYGEDDRDLSRAESYEDFLAGFGEVLKAAALRLDDDRFAAIVVGEVRGADGGYVGLVPDTIRLAGEAGLRFYNEAILVSPVATVAIRAAKPFVATRKIAKSHQQLLVFVKGDPVKATEAIGDVEAGEVPELEGEPTEYGERITGADPLGGEIS